MTARKIYCVACDGLIDARLTDGSEIYSHRPDLYDLPFWKCDACNNFVGCHHKTKNRTNPLGVIPTKQLRNARKAIHAKLDPLWRNGDWSRKEVYKHISDKLGYEYHTAEIRSINEVNKILNIIDKV